MNATRALLGALLLGAGLAGCGGRLPSLPSLPPSQPFSYTSDRELNERPGMFSGEKGAFVISLGGSASETAKPAASPAASRAEYDEFLRWKKERSAAEQREFDEWREWREFQEWRRQRGK